MTEEKAGEICAFIRAAKDIGKAIRTAAVVFCEPEEKIVGTLQHFGLMTADGVYKPPIRLTGKEKTMAWKWMPHKKKLYDQMVSEGKTPEEIAAALGCDEYTVRKYADSLLRQPSPVKTRKIPEKEPSAAAVIKENPVLEQPAKELPEGRPHDMRALVLKAESNALSVMNSIEAGNMQGAFFALGRLSVLIEILKAEFECTSGNVGVNLR